MNNRMMLVCLFVLLGLLALSAARSPGVYDAVRYNAEIVVLNEDTGCTLNYYPHILGSPWVVSDLNGDTVYEGGEAAATNWLLFRCK